MQCYGCLQTQRTLNSPMLLSLVLPGFPALVVVVAGATGSYGEYSIGMVDDQTIIHLCVAHACRIWVSHRCVGSRASGGIAVVSFQVLDQF